MKTATLVSRFSLIVTVVIMAPAALAIEAGQIDDFEDGTTQGWTEGQSPNDPTNVGSGGPEGGNDSYLQNISSGAIGAGGRQVMFNRMQWTGNYTAEEIQSIRMWLRNEGEIDIQIRIAIHGANTWFGSSNGFDLPADIENTWQQVNFPLNANNLTLAEGQASLATVLANVDEVRILAAITPNFRGERVAATLGVDDIEAVGKPLLPQDFKNLVSMADVNGNNSTDVGVFRFDPNANRNRLSVMDGSSGNLIRTVTFGSAEVRGSSTVSDGNGDLVPEFGALLEGSLFARVKDVVNGTLLGKPKFNAKYDTVAFLSVGDAGGGVGPDVVVVGRLPATGKVQAWVKDVASGTLVRRMTFSKAFVPFDAVAVDNVGDSAAMEIAVLGIDASGNVQAQVKDALSGNLINKIQFNKRFTPLFFAAVPNAAGKLKFLAVLGRNTSGVIQATVKQVSNGRLVSKVRFSKEYDPKAFISFADSNGSGRGQIAVIGVNDTGKVRAQVKEIADGTHVKYIFFSKTYPPLDAIAINGVAGTGRNEIAVFGQKANGDDRVQIKDLLTGDLVNVIPIP